MEETFGLGIYYDWISATAQKGIHGIIGPVEFGAHKEFILDLDREV